MSNPPGESLPEWFSPVTGPDQALGAVSIKQLVQLEGVLTPPPGVEAEFQPGASWREAVTAERKERERELEGLRTYSLPLPKSPEYDIKRGPAAYIADIRAINLAGRPTALPSNRSLVLRREVDELARIFVSQNRGTLGSIVGYDLMQVPPEALTDFLVVNLWNIVFTPRLIATTTYEEQKREIIRHWMPGIVLMNAEHLRDRAQEMDITREHIESAKAEVEVLPLKTPVPDFFQLETIHQASILGVLGAEWIKLCNIVHRTDPKLLTVQAYHLQAVLAYRSLEELTSAIRDNRDVEPKEICRLFLRQPVSFDAALAQAKAKAEEKRLIAAHWAAIEQGGEGEGVNPDTIKTTKTEYLPANLRVIQALLNEPGISEEVLDLAFGETLQVTDPDTRIPLKDFDGIVDKHAELIGRVMWQLMPDKSARGVRPIFWNTFSIGTVLRAKHNGELRNLKITRLPVTAEELEETLGEQYNPRIMKPENTSRLIFEIEMKNTGIGATVPAFVSMLMVIRRGQDGRHDTLQKIRQGARTTGPDAALSLRMDSEARAWLAEIMNLKFGTLRGGLPSVTRNATGVKRKR